MDQITVGRFIATTRKERGLTQQELADLFHVGVSVVSSWQNGREIPQPEDMFQLAQLANLSLEDITAVFRPDSAMTLEHQASRTYAHILQQLFSEVEDADSFFFFCYAISGVQNLQGLILSGDQAFHFSQFFIPDDFDDMIAVIVADRHYNRVILAHENLTSVKPVSMDNGVFIVEISTEDDIFFRDEKETNLTARLVLFGV